MNTPVGAHPAGSAGLCPDTMVLPPQSEGRHLRCQLAAGHPGNHSAQDPDNRLLHRTWPPASNDRSLQSARAAAGANVTPLKGPRS